MTFLLELMIKLRKMSKTGMTKKYHPDFRIHFLFLKCFQVLSRFYVYQVLVVIASQTMNCLLITHIVKFLTLLFLYSLQYQSIFELLRLPLHLIHWKVYLRFDIFLKHVLTLGKQFCVSCQSFLDWSIKCSVRKISYCSFPCK